MPSTDTPDGATPTAPAPALGTAAARASNQFGFELWKRVAKAPGNVALSPTSITAALTMAWAGAKGPTEVEMRAVLHGEGEPVAAMTAWFALSRALTAPGRPVTLGIANRMFGEKTLAIEESYRKRTEAMAAAEVERLDFVGAAEKARGTINAWVADKTEQRIKDLLPAGSVDSNTRLVLVNAIYFLADWASPFASDRTTPQPFTLADGKRASVAMMRQVGGFRLARVKGAAVLELPYEGRDLAMLVVLPDAKAAGTAAIEARLDVATLDGWRAALADQRVAVSLPRFTIDPASPMALSGALQALGMKAAFAPDAADFSGIVTPATPEQRLYLSEVFHKAFVKVDEKGTEAAAATAAVMRATGAAPAPPVEFMADRPFLFLIVDQASGLVLFMGRVTDPR
jgi:serpin B